MALPRTFLLLLFLSLSALSQAADVFRQDNLAAWCIVPFDAKKRGPEERAAMLEKLNLKKFVYDYRAEHIPQWDDELNALKKHGIELTGWWFPGSLNDEAKKTLELFQRHHVKPQLWITGNGGSLQAPTPEEQKQRIDKDVARIKPICQAAAPLGCQVALYNHGNWFGEPENMIAIVEALKAQGIVNIGIVYNLHHGHGHLARLDKALAAMMPHLLYLNLNGMDPDGEAKGRKILPLGVGTEDLRVLKLIRDSGYAGPIGILNHTNEDAEGRLQDNLDGLRWLLPQLDGKPAGAKPTYRTWPPKTAASPNPPSANPNPQSPNGVPSLSPEFGKALAGSIALPGKDAYRTLPLTVELRAKLNSANAFNILVACDPKSSSTHWELYSYAKTGFFSVYLPGRGGEFRSKTNIRDGQWHELCAIIEEDKVSLYIDGKLSLEKPAQPLKGDSKPGGLGIGQLAEGSLGCDGLIDNVRISRGVMKPRKGDHPLQMMDITLGLWNFDDLAQREPAPEPAAYIPEKKPLHPEDYAHWQHFVNRDRTFDYYGKQAVHFMGKPLPPLIPSFPGLDGGQIGHWGNQNDAETWKDGRFAAQDHGAVFSSVFKGGGITLVKGVAVRLGDAGEMSACFDPLTLSFPVVWKDGFIKLSDARHGFMGGGVADGQILKKEPPVMPTEPFIYHGYYRHGKKVVFSYKRGGVEMLDSAWTHDSKFQRIQEPRAQSRLDGLTKGGETQWPGWIELKGQLGKGAPFAVDTIPIPFENPYGTLFFISGQDFFSDGTAAVATMTGEVWLVRGIDDTLQHVKWKRFATGLHQPLGVKIDKDKLYVLGRDQITCLHDLNGDDEADFYECVTNVQTSSPGGHDFITGLDRDSEGRFYFASGNQGVCRVTLPDSLEVLATGFRNPNGIGLSPDGTVTTSVQEGDWTPASEILQIKVGSHYGAGGPRNGEPPEPPLIYMPRAEDNSSGGQCFITTQEWAPVRGQDNLVHCSPGTGSAFLVMRQKVNGRWQGAAVRISGSFDSGSQTERFSPKDGQLYVTGMQGWGSYTPKDGCFQRVRYVGGGVPFPIVTEARDNGVLLRFNAPLDKAFAAKAANHFAQCWNYRYSAAYGSPELSVRYPDASGHDPLEVHSAHVIEDGKALFLEIPQLVTANMIHLHVGITPDRAHDIFLTAHGLAPAFTEFPGYQKITKTMHAADASATISLTTNSKPNPWAKGEPGRPIKIDAALGLQYVQKTLTAKAGERLSLTFTNPDVVPHNWMLAKPGTLKKIGDLANLMITDPQGLAKHYVPDSPDVIVYTDMTNPKGAFTIHFQAPKEKGDYPYLCTFPGHWMVMNGILKVE